MYSLQVCEGHIAASDFRESQMSETRISSDWRSGQPTLCEAFRRGKSDVIASMVGTIAEIDLLYVHKGSRKSGIGTALLSTAEAWAKKNGAEHVIVKTPTWQAPNFYPQREYGSIATLPLRTPDAFGGETQYEHVFIKPRQVLMQEAIRSCEKTEIDFERVGNSLTQYTVNVSRGKVGYDPADVTYSLSSTDEQGRYCASARAVHKWGQVELIDLDAIDENAGAELLSKIRSLNMSDNNAGMHAFIPENMEPMFLRSRWEKRASLLRENAPNISFMTQNLMEVCHP